MGANVVVIAQLDNGAGEAVQVTLEGGTSLRVRVCVFDLSDGDARPIGEGALIAPEFLTELAAAIERAQDVVTGAVSLDELEQLAAEP